MLVCCDRYIEDLRKRIIENDPKRTGKGLEIDVNSEMKELALNMLTETIFGFAAPKGLPDVLGVFATDFLRASGIWRLPFIGKYLPNPALRNIEAAQRFIYNLIDDLLKDRSEKLLSGR